MVERQVSMRRTLAGLVLAILVAPVATVIFIEVARLLTQSFRVDHLPSEIGAFVIFIVFALAFGSVITAIPGLLFGSFVIVVARTIGTRSPVFYAGAGLFAGTLIAWVETGRTKGAFAMADAVPFVIGGCLSALTYWAVAER